MFNVTYDSKLILKHKQRPISTLNKKLNFPPNITFNKSLSKDKISKIISEEKNYSKKYLNISKGNRNSLILQKKLFYNKIYNNKNYEKKDLLGLSEFINIKKENKRKQLIKTKENSISKLSSASTFRKINIRSKSIKKTSRPLDEFKSNEVTNATNKNKDNINSKENKSDKICEINTEELQKVYSSNNNYNNSIVKKRPISVSMLLNREKNIPKKLDIKLEDVKTAEKKITNLYIIKFGHILDMFKKIIPSSDWIRMDLRTTFINITTNLFKSFEIFNKILLEKISDEICLQALNHFCEEILSWQKLMIEEIRYLKKENIFLEKRQKYYEKELNEKKEIIKKINEDIIKYDLNKVNKGKKDESKVEKIKNNFINVESNYVVTIFNLQKEINQLNEILGQKKEEKTNNDELKNKIIQLREELAECKTFILQTQFNQKNKDKLNDLYIEEILQKNRDFENEKLVWKEKENKFAEEIINLKAKIERLNERIKEKDKIILESEKKINENNKMQIYYENIPKEPANVKLMDENKIK